MGKYIACFLFISLLGVSCLSDKQEMKEEHSVLLEEVRQQLVPDRRVGIYDISCSVSKGGVTLKGQTTSAEAKKILLQQLKESYQEVKDSLLLLPDVQGLEGKTYGVVRLSVCNIRSAPDFSSEMVTQAVMGTPVRILQRNNWYQIQTPDQYIGWVHSAAITPMTKAGYEDWNKAEKVIVTSHYGFAVDGPEWDARSVSDVVAGSRLKLLKKEKNNYQIAYPDGRQAYLSVFLAQSEKEWRASLQQDAHSILSTAQTLLGVPYLWAGISSKGMDCSGFVRNVLYMHDIIIPRDASQQAYITERIEIAPDCANLEPGDLLFFGRKATADKKERIVHVAFYLGDKKFIHSQGDVRINSLDPNSEQFDEFNLNRLLFATRILPYINKIPEINTTATNPYYLLGKSSE